MSEFFEDTRADDFDMGAAVRGLYSRRMAEPHQGECRTDGGPCDSCGYGKRVDGTCGVCQHRRRIQGQLARNAKLIGRKRRVA